VTRVPEFIEQSDGLASEHLNKRVLVLILLPVRLVNAEGGCELTINGELIDQPFGIVRIFLSEPDDLHFAIEGLHNLRFDSRGLKGQGSDCERCESSGGTQIHHLPALEKVES